MYSRYIPNDNGGFDRTRIEPDPASPPNEPIPAAPVRIPPRQRAQQSSGLLSLLRPPEMETVDWLILAVMVLSLLDGGEEPLTALTAAAIYLFLQ